MIRGRTDGFKPPRLMCAVAVLAIALTVACAPSPLRLPTGAGEPFPDYQATLEQATNVCREVQTLTAELAVSGRAGRQRLRGRVLAALAKPQAIRLEGLAPFGPPAFILVAPGGYRRDSKVPTSDPAAASVDPFTVEGVLVLPRDQRVVIGERVPLMLEAITGIRLDAEELLALLSGCASVTNNAQAVSGTRYGDAWIRIGLADGGAVYLKPDNLRQIVAGQRGPLTVEHGAFSGGFPREVRVRSAMSRGAAIDADVTIRISQLETNTPLDAEVFTVKMPESLRPMTLEELRQAGPLGDAETTRRD